MHDFEKQYQFKFLAMVCLLLFLSKQSIMITRFRFCDILNNQGLRKCYQPRPFSARQITLIPGPRP